MKNLLLIISLAILNTVTFEAFGQIKRTQLQGDWKTNNQDSLYYKSDSVKFYLGINHWLDIEACNLVIWSTKKGKFRFINSYICSEPGRVNWLNVKEKLKLTKTDYGQILELKRANSVIERFKILDFQITYADRYPHETKELTILRFDKLEDQKLYNYIDSLVYQVLNHEPDAVDSTAVNIITQGAAAIASKIIIRDAEPKNPKPLLVINGILVQQNEILREFLFVEAITIKYLTKEQSASIYGYRAINGVIILQVSNKKFKKVWKNIEGN